MKGNKKREYVMGVDEVGRGALAGPVVVAVVLIKKNSSFRSMSALIGDAHLPRLRDSKKLSSRQRRSWFLHMKSSAQVVFAIGRVYPRAIENMNISRAANLAALRAYKRLVARRSDARKSDIFLDGGLYLGSRARQGSYYPMAKTLIKADEKVVAVALASIVAKVHRDAILDRLDAKYPEYGFKANKGYGTKRHCQALGAYGPSPVHRLTFLKKKHTIPS